MSDGVGCLCQRKGLSLPPLPSSSENKLHIGTPRQLFSLGGEEVSGSRVPRVASAKRRIHPWLESAAPLRRRFVIICVQLIARLGEELSVVRYVPINPLRRRRIKGVASRNSDTNRTHSRRSRSSGLLSSGLLRHIRWAEACVARCVK